VSSMEEQIKAMREKIEAAAAAITDSKEMYQLRKQYLDNKAGHLPCRPCSIYGNKECRLSEKYKCLNDIDIRTIVDKACR
ncbi:MAG: hypothetical protein IKM98_00175, partial [Bacteroidales bacterium]|nr:hypothetical protein [Bacteroidales bacterium]